jgi:hypothetical protein
MDIDLRKSSGRRKNCCEQNREYDLFHVRESSQNQVGQTSAGVVYNP